MPTTLHSKSSLVQRIFFLVPLVALLLVYKPAEAIHASFTYSLDTVNNEITLKNTSTDFTTNTKFTWWVQTTQGVWIGGAYYDSLQSVVMKLPYKATYKIKLYAWDSTQTPVLNDSAVLKLSIHSGLEYPMIDFTYQISGYQVTFTVKTNRKDLKYTWYLGEGNSDTGLVVTHTFLHDKVYSVELQSFESFNNDYHYFRVDKTIQIPACVSSFNLKQYGKIVQCSATGNNGSSTKYNWDFGDGGSDTGMGVTHVYSQGGSYYIKLTVKDSSKSCLATKETLVQVDKAAKSCHAAFRVVSTAKRAFFANYSLPKDGPLKYHWDFGDGTTASDKDPYHTFGHFGKYTITLTVTDTITGDTDQYATSAELKGLEFGGYIDLEPKISHGDTTYYKPTHAVVYLIKFNPSDSSCTIVDSVHSQGRLYQFWDADTGIYLVKAALSDSDSLYGQYIPTYAYHTIDWKDADTSVISVSGNYAYILMKRAKGHSGSGHIGGGVTEGHHKKEGDPVKHAEVILLDASREPVAYTYSHDDGSFDFNNLAWGTYILYAEVPGIKPVEGTVTLSQDTPEVVGAEITVGEKTVMTSIPAINHRAGEGLRIYPNPSSGLFYIDMNVNESAAAQLYIYSLTGQLVHQESMQLHKGMQHMRIDAAGLAEGLYRVQLVQGGRQYSANILLAR